MMLLPVIVYEKCNEYKPMYIQGYLNIVLATEKFLVKLIIGILMGVILGACQTAITTQEESSHITYVVRDQNASFFNVPRRISALQAQGDMTIYNLDMSLEQCEAVAIPAPINTYVRMPLFYEDKAGWREANKPFENFEFYVTGLAEWYVASGDSRYAKCLIKALEHWASSNALMDYGYHGSEIQAWFAIEWATSSAALAYSVVRADPTHNPADLQEIDNWLAKVATKQTGFKGGGTSCCNNHYYWRGLEAVIAGVVSNNNDLFRFGITAYLHALKEMNSDGGFPLELARGDRAIHYQNFAILPLVFIAEVAAQQGYDLYGIKIDGKDIPLAIDFLKQQVKSRANWADQDWSFYRRFNELAWTEPYVARFENTEIEAWLDTKRPVRHRWSGGNSSLYFYKTR
jgi:poly(beta-D-mannuronate) lyase